jgi:hypothetical protein
MSRDVVEDATIGMRRYWHTDDEYSGWRTKNPEGMVHRQPPAIADSEFDIELLLAVTVVL